MIDYIMNSTAHQKIHYIGHSMGTTGFIVTMNKRPEYAYKIKMANLLSPIVYLKHMKMTAVKFAAQFTNPFKVSNSLNGSVIKVACCLI
jgi:lysosomal acid lipase/cholesteryl ester hydrolase